ncbi:MAG: glycoside hydrolase family 3 protein [Myxococcota bacterium]
MNTRYRLPIALIFLASLVACGGDGDGASEDVVPDVAPDADVPADAVPDAEEDVDVGPLAECDKPANADRRQSLLDAQPEVEGRAKGAITATITWASLADDPEVTCSVDLEFKDSNDNGTLDPYEDWTRTPEERAGDLLGRMSEAEKLGLMAHATTTDAPSSSDPDVSDDLEAAILEDHVRFGLVTSIEGQLGARATWANDVQELCEGTDLGIPFVLSMEPAHSEDNGRVKAAGFSRWPHELGLASTGDPSVAETFGQVVSQEYRALGVRMALSPSADLATEPRWFHSQFTFGEDADAVADMVEAYIAGLQGPEMGQSSVAAVVGHFPGAGPQKDGWDARLDKGRLLAWPGDNLDFHLVPFERAIDGGVAGVMPGYGVLEAGDWSALGGLVDGTTLEQVGASFNDTLLTDVLRDHYGFEGLVLAPRGVVRDAGLDPLGAPWGVEGMTASERAAEAILAGVDQIGGLNDPAPIADALGAELIGADRVDAAAGRALAVIFALGLFEDPYVDPMQAPALVNTDDSYRVGLDAMNRSMVLLVNDDKPDGWLNGDGDGTQTGDKGNAGNGSLAVLPAPPGEPYVSPGCSYFIMGNFDLDYVRSVSAGYGEMTNDATSIAGVPVDTAEDRIPRTNYVFIRMDAPYTVDPDSGPLEYSEESLEYASNANADVLDDLAFARDAIDAVPDSQTQIIVGVDAGRPSVVEEILSYGVSGLYVTWSVTDKVFLDVAFGIVDGAGALPVGLPASDAAAEAQAEDLPDDGQDPTFVEGFGIPTTGF